MPNDDYILRGDALKAIRYENWREENRVPSIEGLHLTKYQLLAKAINDIPAADVEPKRRWTPVTERLPECEVGAEIGNVEWIIHDMVFAGCFGRGGKYRDAYFRTWTDTTEGIDAKDADCWRVVTLPEPPKEEES